MLIDNFVQYIKTHSPEYVPSVIFDIGSRDLEQSIEFNSVWGDASVFAFEPTPTQFKICNDKSKRYKKIFAHDLALSDNVGSSDFWVTDGNIGCSSLLEPIHIPFASNSNKEKITVSTTTAHEFISKNSIDLKNFIVWMDVQGHELPVLNGFGKYIENVDFIHLEAAETPYYKNHSSKSKIEQFLLDNGFGFVFSHVPHPFGEGDILARRIK